MTDNRIDGDAPRHGKGQNKKRIIGFIIIGAIAFGIFVPVFPLPGGTYTFCDYRAGNCRTITNYGSLTEIYFCLGTEADTAGHILCVGVLILSWSLNPGMCGWFVPCAQLRSEMPA